MYRTRRKGVSPLIAAVLLIAFTMAIAAILTAWVTTVTRDKQEETVQMQEKMKCAGANFKADPVFAVYDRSDDGLFRTRLENIGFETIVLSNILVTYDEYPAPFVINVSSALVDPDSATIPIKVLQSVVFDPRDVVDDEGFDLSTFGSPKEIRFNTECEGVWARLTRPATGWN
jgi:flagellin-like protein